MFGLLCHSWSTGFGMSQEGFFLKLGPQSLEADQSLQKKKISSIIRLIEMSVTFTDNLLKMVNLGSQKLTLTQHN